MASTEQLVASLERAPAIILPLVRQANPAILKRRPAPKEWSIHENACHLAEVHPLFFRRLDLMLSETNPEIKSYDPGRDEPDDALLKLDLADSLRRFEADRARLVARLRERKTLRMPSMIPCTTWSGRRSTGAMCCKARYNSGCKSSLAILRSSMTSPLKRWK